VYVCDTAGIDGIETAKLNPATLLMWWLNLLILRFF